MSDAFVGYPSGPPELVDNIEAGIQSFRGWRSATRLIPWTDLKGPSTPIISDVLNTIRDTEVAFFDITVPNQNVFYEIGYAVGLGKPVHLLLNNGIKHALKRNIDLGLFDTQRLKRYRNGSDFANILRDARDPHQQTQVGTRVDARQPIFFQHHQSKIEFATSYFASVKQQKLGLRTYDPEEDHRLPLDRAFREISSSAGVFLSLLPETVVGAEEHNLRAYLLAGIADATATPRTLLKYGDFVAAFDLRDGVTTVRNREEIRDAVVTLLPRVHERLQELQTRPRVIKRSHLINISLGSSSAENEIRSLDTYFLETREFQRTLRGEARLVVGRKGAGKTAIFWQVRDRVRANRSNLVLDLRPEGFQLRKLSEVIADNFSGATFAHTMTVFWEYVLYLELTHKILEDDRNAHTRDSRLIEKYGELRDAYENVHEFREGDFPERLLRLIGRLRTDIRPHLDANKEKILTTPEITELVYRTEFPALRDLIFQYLALKRQNLILIDNLDRGWTASGISQTDVRIVQCLIDAGRRVERTAQKRNVELTTVIFLRDDVYDWLISDTIDRGKESIVRVVWNDVALLRQLVERRLEAASLELKIEPPLQWSNIASGQIENEAIFEFLTRHCLRRPRSLLDLIELCLSNAALSGRSEIEAKDATRAVASYSVDMLRDLNFEIRDVFPEADKIIYAFTREGVRLDQKNVERIANRQLKDIDLSSRFVRMMLWFGFFGIIDPDGHEAYVFDHGDDLELLYSHAGRAANPILCIHPLFRSALSNRTDLLL